MPITRPDSDIDRELTGLAVSHSKKMDDLCAPRVFLSVPVTEQRAQYTVYPKGCRDISNPKASSKHLKLYEVRDHTQQEFVGESTMMNTPDPSLCDHDAAKAATEKLLCKNLEEKFCKRFLQPGVWAQNVTGVPRVTNYGNNQIKQWSNKDTDPAVDITALSCTMESRTGGLMPNKVCMARDVWDAIEEHPMLAHSKSGSEVPNSIQEKKDWVAARFEVNEVVIMEMMHIKKGFLLLFHQAQNYTLDIPRMTAGVNFVYSEHTNPVSVEDSLWGRKCKASDPGIRGHYVEVGCSLDFCMVSPDCGTLIQNLV